MIAQFKGSEKFHCHIVEVESEASEQGLQESNQRLKGLWKV